MTLLPVVAPDGQALPAQEAVRERPLSLETTISEALAGNADLRVAAARSDMAEAAADGGAAIYWPRLDFESGFVRSNDPVFAFGTQLRQGTFTQADFDPQTLNNPDPTNDWVNRIALRWKVFSPGDWTARGVASREAEAVRWSAARTREATVLQAEVLYLEVQRTAAQQRAAQAAEAAAGANRDVFARRVDQGLLTRADLLQAEADHSFAVARRVDQERLATNARRNLAIFLGWDASELPVPTDTLRLSPPKASDMKAATPFDPAARADLRTLSAAREAANADARRAGQSYLPEVGVFASYGIHGADAFTSDGDNWTVGVGLKWNIFSGFRRSNDKQRSDAALVLADTRYETAVRQARAELDEARAGVAAVRQALEASIAGDRAAEAGSELMRRRFEEGLATASDLLQAESRRARAESHAIDTQAGYHMTEARLRFVTTLHANGNDQ